MGFFKNPKHLAPMKCGLIWMNQLPHLGLAGRSDVLGAVRVIYTLIPHSHSLKKRPICLFAVVFWSPTRARAAKIEKGRKDPSLEKNSQHDRKQSLSATLRMRISLLSISTTWLPTLWLNFQLLTVELCLLAHLKKIQLTWRYFGNPYISILP